MKRHMKKHAKRRKSFRSSWNFKEKSFVSTDKEKIGREKKEREATATLRRAVAFTFEIAGSKEWYVVDATLQQALSKRL